MRVGDKVRLRDPDSFVAEVRKACSGGRVGEVVGLTWPDSQPIVKFPATGRKREFILGQCFKTWLELVIDPAQTGKEGA